MAKKKDDSQFAIRDIERLKRKFKPAPKEDVPQKPKSKEDFRGDFLSEYHPKYRGRNGLR